MASTGYLKASVRVAFFIGILTIAACSTDNQKESNAEAISQLSSPSSYALSGTGVSQVGSTNYLFATAAGTIGTSGNTMTAGFADPNLPLGLYSTYGYSMSMNAGSCSALGSIVSWIAGDSGQQVVTQLSATGCSDQATINVILDTAQIYDTFGNSGSGLITLIATVDLAPEATVAASGNTAIDGTGTTEASAGTFTIASDNSIVVTFSKSLTGGTLTGALSGTGCTATLGTPSIVTGSSGTIVAWGLTGFSGFTPGQTCTLNVSGVADVAGNPDDPSDPNLNMTLTFQ